MRGAEEKQKQKRKCKKVHDRDGRNYTAELNCWLAHKTIKYFKSDAQNKIQEIKRKQERKLVLLSQFTPALTQPGATVN